MKLKRRAELNEIRELLMKGKVVPKRRNMYFWNTEGEYEITLNMLRSKLDEDDGLYAPNGYEFSDVKGITFQGKNLDLKKIKEKYVL